eukprot:NODE_507_length_7471_cov_0.263158.p2 type:complete len:162 gc:universal NODE_507_length_7471_cov_0.263158:7417-6932(-)
MFVSFSCYYPLLPPVCYSYKMSHLFFRQFYRFNLQKREIDFVLKYAPQVEKKQGTVSKSSPTLDERVEMIRRILTSDTASLAESSIFKQKGVVGSSGQISFQIRNLDVKIHQLKQHLSSNHKDLNTKRILQEYEFKQIRNLKYLKKKNPTEYIQIQKELAK